MENNNVDIKSEFEELVEKYLEDNYVYKVAYYWDELVTTPSHTIVIKNLITEFVNEE